MKPFLISLFIICLAQNLFSQITGRLTTANGQPIALANILLQKAGDTAVVQTTVTDSIGVFTFNKAIPGRYILHFNSVGYKQQQLPVFELMQNDTKNVGVIVMQEDAAQLQAVVVRAAKPLYQQKAEGIVVNVENDILTKGSSALEVLERSPGVVVDHHNNNISLNGKNGVTVMINGKTMHMSMEQLLTLLASMSADDVATVELLNTPGAKYDADGNAGIINIVLKKDKEKGNNGSVTVTGGYGKYEKASASLRFDHNTGKTDVYESYSYWHDKSYGFLDANGYEVVPALNGATDFKYWGQNTSIINGHYARAGIDQKLTPKLTVGASVTYSSSVYNSHSFNRDEYLVLPDSLLLFSGHINGASQSKNLVTSVYAEKQIKEGEKWNIDIDYLRYNITSPTTVQSDFIDKNGNDADATGDSLFSPMQKGYGNAVIQVGVAKFDYTKKLGKNTTLETGLKGTYTKSDASSGIETLINGEWVTPTETVNDMIMKEGIGAAYASVNIQLSKSISITAGARYEYYYTHANNAQTGAVAISRSFGQLFPSIFFTKKLDDNNELLLSYTKRITRPSYNDLASYVNYNDPLSVFTGNPLLKPTITNNIKLGYNYKKYNFFLLFSRDNNAIAEGQVTSSPSGYIVYISPQNVAWQNNITLQTNIPVKVNKWWNMNYSAYGGWHKYRVDYTIPPATKQFYSVGLNFMQTFTLPHQVSAEVTGEYGSASYFATGKNMPHGTVDVGIKKVLNNNKGTFQLSVTDVLSTNHYVGDIGSFVHVAFDTKAHINWHGESYYRPIFKLSYTRSFGGQQKATHQTNLDDEKGRVK